MGRRKSYDNDDNVSRDSDEDDDDDDDDNVGTALDTAGVEGAEAGDGGSGEGGGGGRGEGGDNASPVNQCLHITKLSERTSAFTLQKAFETYGDIEKVILVVDPVTKVSRRFSFITYKSAEHAVKALSSMQGAKIDGRPIRVDFAKRQQGYDRTPGRFVGDPKHMLNEKYIASVSRDSISPRHITGDASYARDRDRDRDDRDGDRDGDRVIRGRRERSRSRSRSRDKDYRRDRERGHHQPRIDRLELQIGVIESDLRALKEEVVILRRDLERDRVAAGGASTTYSGSSRSIKRGRSRSRSRSRDRSRDRGGDGSRYLRHSSR